MKKNLCLLLLAFPLMMMAQEQGIHFEHGLSWQQIKAKAKAENKYIFIDCYATWCSPCRAMARAVFPEKAAGDFFNKNFINVKLQMDSTEKDNAEVKEWYAASKEMAVKYDVNVFPTFLFFNPGGEIVHRISGASSDVNEFIALASDALDNNKQYYTQIKKFEKGDRSPEFLKHGAQTALDADDYTNAVVLFDEYLSVEKNIFTKENLEFAAGFVKSSKGKSFELFLNNHDKIDAILGKGASDDIVMPVIAGEEVYSKIKMNDPAPDWAALKTSITEKYPQKKQQVDRMVTWSKVGFYQAISDWPNYAASATDYMNNYGQYADALRLNDLAGHIATTTDDTGYLNKALGWSKKSIEMNEKDALSVATYAVLLYRLDKKEEAIAYGEKAVTLVPETDSYVYKEIVEKMKRGEKKVWQE